MSYEVKCYAAPFENTTCFDLDQAYDLCYNLSEEYGHTDVIQWVGPHQHVIASYTWGK